VTLLDSGAWSGTIYSGGWIAAHGGDMPIVEPATGARFGGSANLDAFTDQRWITMRGDIPAHPFSDPSYDS
jgi:hypothetical protein